MNLNSIGDKDYFLSSFNDPTIVKAIKNIQEIFNKHPFHDPAILEHAKSKTEISLITKWQRQYYLDIYNEYHKESITENSRVIELYKLLQANDSFKFLVDLLAILDNNDEMTNKKILNQALSYSYLKLQNPYIKENNKKNKEKLEKYTAIINTGGSVLNMIDADEKSYIEKSVDLFFSNIRDRENKK